MKRIWTAAIIALVVIAAYQSEIRSVSLSVSETEDKETSNSLSDSGKPKTLSLNVGVSTDATKEALVSNPPTTFSHTQEEGPADLPDWDQIERNKEDFKLAWSKVRADILYREAHLDEEAIQNLDRKNAEYRLTLTQWIQSRPSNSPIVSRDEVERLAQLNQSYQNEVRSVVGEQAFAALDSARSSLVHEYATRGYEIPVNFF